jgi:hypothetical protein
MEEAPNTRPGLGSALATGGVLLVILAVLFAEGFSGESFLHHQNRSLAGWDTQFDANGWNAQTGLGHHTHSTPMGFSELIHWLCSLTGDPAANFANYYPAACLLLLGMAGWLLARSLGASGIVCTLAALAAALNGVFFTSAVEHSGGLAVMGAAVCVALAALLRPRLEWPATLVGGIALGVGILETGPNAVPLLIVVSLVGVAAKLNIKESERTLNHVIAIALVPLTALAVAAPIFFSHISYPAIFSTTFNAKDLLTIPMAGLTGHRMDAPDQSVLWGTSFSGSAHAGALVLLLIGWALVNALRKASAMSAPLRFRCATLGGLALVGLVAATAYPQMLVAFTAAAVGLFAIGLQGLDDWQTTRDHEKTRGFGQGGWNTAWRMMLLAAMLGMTISLVIFSGDSLLGATLKKQLSQQPQLIESMAAASDLQQVKAVMFLVLTAFALIAASLVKWKAFARVLFMGLLGLVLTLELGLANMGFLRYDHLTDTQTANDLTSALRQSATNRWSTLPNDYDRTFGRSIGRIAPLNQFYKTAVTPPVGVPLDREITSLFTAPPDLSAKDYHPDNEPLANGYFFSLTNYTRLEDATAFNQMVQAILKPTDQAMRDAALNRLTNEVRVTNSSSEYFGRIGVLTDLKEQYATVQFNDGSQPVTVQQTSLERIATGEYLRRAGRDPALLNYMSRAAERLQLDAQAHVTLREMNETLGSRIWREQLAQAGLGSAINTQLPRPPTVKSDTKLQTEEAYRLLVRQWELTSTRYFLSHAGNHGMSEQVRNQQDRFGLPVYHNALNELLDPHLRRFQSIASFNIEPTNTDTNRAALKLTTATNGLVALMEFTGALPRAKLFADWRTDVADEDLLQHLYHPGFDPHAQVLINSKTIPAPEFPSQTLRLPAPKFAAARANHVELIVPPVKFGTVLTLNDVGDADWSVTIDGQSAELLRGNGYMRAVHLPKSDANRTVVFRYHPHGTDSSQALLIILPGLALAGFGAMRRREVDDKNPQEPKSTNEPDSDKKPDEA